MSHKVRVAIIDEHPLYRDGVAYNLAAQPDIEVIGQGETSSDAIQMAREISPDVIIINLCASGGGMKAVEEITLLCPTVKTLALAAAPDEEQVCAALRHGARGYVLKDVGGAELVRIVRILSRDESYVSPSLAARLLTRFGAGHPTTQRPSDRFAELSPREEQILSRLVHGLSNKEIALKLDLSEKTIKHHVTNILQKLKVRNRVEAAILASGRASKGYALHQ